MGFFDWGRGAINKIPIYGSIASAIWGDPGQEDHQDSLKKAAEEKEKMRAYMMDARMNAMNQGAMAFGPRNQMLGEMMGKGPGQNAMDLGPMLQNPMPQAMQDDIRKQAFGNTPQGQPQGQPPAVPNPAFGGPQPNGPFAGTGQQNPYRRQ
jgi:hypothetical protein